MLRSPSSSDIPSRSAAPKKKRSISRNFSRVEKPRKRLQKFRRDWLNNEIFKKWIIPDEKDDFKAKCKVCNLSLTADVTVLKFHGRSKNHLKHINSLQETSSIASAFARVLDEDSTLYKAKRAEIKISAFFAEHNIAFKAADHLSLLLKDCFPDSKIASEVSFKRKKTTAIVRNVIGASYKDKLASKIRYAKFSVITDESTDISCVKTSCVVIRYFDSETGKIESKFWDLHQVYSGDEPEKANEGATAENLFKSLIESFNIHSIPLKNIVGFGADGCNTMMGKHNSLASRFIQMCPGIHISKCICHSAHICASEACKALPTRCEELARSIYTFFKNSSKRSAQLVQFQKFVDVKPHKIMHPSQTRWLSVQAVVLRTLEQWHALTLFFTDMAISERLISGQQILDWLTDPFLKLYYHFLNWILPKFTSLNLYFQTSKVVIHELNEKMEEIYRDILLCFMDRRYIMQNKINDIDPTKKEKYLKETDMYLGVEVNDMLQTATIKDNHVRKTEFFKRCQQFFQIAVIQIKKRWDFGNTFMLNLPALSPKHALSNQFREKTPSIIPLCRSIKCISAEYDVKTLQELDDQWRNLPIVEIPDDIKREESIDLFWAKLLNLENAAGDKKFTILAQFALDALTIPHANADCERIFSKVNLTKTKTRNRLITKTVNGVLLASEALKENQTGCVQFNPTKEMHDRMTKRNLYDNENESDEDFEIRV